MCDRPDGCHGLFTPSGDPSPADTFFLSSSLVIESGNVVESPQELFNIVLIEVRPNVYIFRLKTLNTHITIRMQLCVPVLRGVNRGMRLRRSADFFAKSDNTSIFLIKSER